MGGLDRKGTWKRGNCEEEKFNNYMDFIKYFIKNKNFIFIFCNKETFFFID